jgi:coenzyme F420-0:L-glutamate ligase/coenzyme F420-1:gamma-L-glutamate ligase
VSAHISAFALRGLPEIERGDDLAALIATAAGELADDEIVVVAHKAVSKAQGRVRRLADIDPGTRAKALAAEHGKDPRHVQAILDESSELLRAERGVLIVRTLDGFVCANAGVDESNAPAQDTVVLLPRDPDGTRTARPPARSDGPGSRCGHHRQLRARLAPRAARHRDRRGGPDPA